MNKAVQKPDNSAQDNSLQGQAYLNDTLPVHVYDPAPHLNLPAAGVSQIITAIENYQGKEDTNIVHFTSAYNKEGAALIALQTALNISSYKQCKTLLVEVLDKDAAARYGVSAALDEYSLNTQRYTKTDAQPMAQFDGSQCFYIALSCPDQETARWRADRGMIKDLLAWAQDEYDQVIVYSQNAAANNNATRVSPMVKGTVLIIEAERVRNPVAKKLKGKILEQGGDIIGSVMNKRRYFIPGWLYQLFFKTQ